MKYKIRSKISYLFKARHRKGHGIHSPFLFRLITEVIENKGQFSAYPLLRAADENVRNTVRILDMKSYHPKNSSHSHNCRYCKNQHLLPERFDRMLFRLVNDFRPGEIAFYGSTFGVTLLALALADRRIKLNAQIENDHYRSFCRRLAEVYEIENIDISGAGEVSAAGFVVIQNPLEAAYCDHLLAQIMLNKDYDGVIILCGIHNSPGMEGVWTKYKNEAVVRVSLDLFEVGIYICKKGLQKEEFIVRF